MKNMAQNPILRHCAPSPHLKSHLMTHALCFDFPPSPLICPPLPSSPPLTMFCPLYPLHLFFCAHFFSFANMKELFMDHCRIKLYTSCVFRPILNPDGYLPSPTDTLLPLYWPSLPHQCSLNFRFYIMYLPSVRQCLPA